MKVNGINIPPIDVNGPVNTQEMRNAHSSKKRWMLSAARMLVLAEAGRKPRSSTGVL
jgi:hypothetical protein